MSTVRKDSIIIGLLFIIAMIGSLLGGTIIEGVIATDGYLETLLDNSLGLMVGVILEITNGIAVIGIAVILYKYIKELNERLAVGYTGLRIIEAISCVFAAVVAMSFITLSKNFSAIDSANLNVIENVIYGFRSDILGLLVPIFFSFSGLILYYVLYKTKLVPRFISIWGIIAVVLIFSMNVFGISGNIQILFALPIITNELFLGFYLIFRGFKFNKDMKVI
ncbi:MAG: DUF4386 domain-containing protein [Bacillota bacterium]